MELGLRTIDMISMVRYNWEKDGIFMDTFTALQFLNFDTVPIAFVSTTCAVCCSDFIFIFAHSFVALTVQSLSANPSIYISSISNEVHLF